MSWEDVSENTVIMFFKMQCTFSIFSSEQGCQHTYTQRKTLQSVYLIKANGHIIHRLLFIKY